MNKPIIALGLLAAICAPLTALAADECDELVREADTVCTMLYDYEEAQEDREERELIRACLEDLIPATCGVEVTDLLP